METKTNAYAVLRLCEEDPHYDHKHLTTDICGHIAQHAQTELFDDNGAFQWPYFVNHIGLAEVEWPLWQLLCEDQLEKHVALRRFAAMILQVHGPAETGVPSILRLL
jgi:hypothetical protein